jgi:hypothetical protein
MARSSKSGISRREIFKGLSAVAVALRPTASAGMQEDRSMVLGYDWEYDNANIIDPPLEAMLGTANELQSWLTATRASLINPFLNAPVPSPIAVHDGLWQNQQGANGTPSYQHLHIIGDYAQGSLLYNQWVGCYIAKPQVVDPTKPLVICLHGHEVNHRGEPPHKLFTEHWWPEQIVQAGYCVLAPSHLLYNQLSSLYSAWDYHAVWVKFIWDIIQAAPSAPSGNIPQYTGMVVAGLSAGGLSGSMLMAWRPEISRGIFAGSLLPMEFLRQNYRVPGHPDEWNLRNLYSYLPYYLYCADRRVQWQLGQGDSFYPDHTALAPINPWFPGTDRDVMTTEVLGDYLPVRDAANKLGGVADLLIHSGGHEFRVTEALSFLSAP